MNLKDNKVIIIKMLNLIIVIIITIIIIIIIYVKILDKYYIIDWLIRLVFVYFIYFITKS